jgi:phosphoglycerol transferase MdoB-like AlkP superfamily enzyme
MIPKEFHDLPVHALAVHGAVVLIPLAALLGLLFAVPRLRNWAALPMAIVSVAALISVYVARASGFNLKSHIAGFSQSTAEFDKSALGKAILDHESKANVLFYMMIVFTIIAVAVYLLWRRQEQFTGTVEWVACAVLVIAALVVTVQTIRVGEAGSKAVWNPDGSQNFNSSAQVELRR